MSTLSVSTIVVDSLNIGNAVINTTSFSVNNSVVNSTSVSTQNVIANTVSTNSLSTNSVSTSNLSVSTNTVTIGTALNIATNGNIGVSNTAPGQKLVVAGTIESTSGGFKFPDGTSQDTKAVAMFSNTVVASTSGTTIDFLNIPSTAKQIIVMFSEVSLSATADVLVRIGSSAGANSTGYVSTSTVGTTASSSTTGYIIRSASATTAISGLMIINLIGSNEWVASSSCKISTTQVAVGGGSKTLPDVLDRIRITTTNGTDTFDAGRVNISWI